MTYSALFSASFLCSNVKFMTFVYSVSALEVLLVYTALYKLSFIIIMPFSNSYVDQKSSHFVFLRIGSSRSFPESDEVILVETGLDSLGCNCNVSSHNVRLCIHSMDFIHQKLQLETWIQA